MKQSKSDYAVDLTNSVNHRPLSFALRELLMIVSGPLFWIVCVSVALLAVLAGPYFTLERLSFAERIVFWGSTVIGSHFLMTFLSIYTARLSEIREWHWIFSSLLAVVLGALPVVGIIYLSEGLASGFEPQWYEFTSFRSLFMNVVPALFAVTLMVNLALRLKHAEPDEASISTEPFADNNKPTLTALQRKLPRHLGHEIVAVQAQDHYVEVTTLKGSTMVFTRLGDAVQQLEPLSGLQVHRSWWINTAHISRIENGPNGPELIMSSNQRIPVERKFRAAFKEAIQD